MKRILLSLCIFTNVLLLSGCFTHYRGRPQLPQDLINGLKIVEDYYLLNARKKAAFLANCPLEETTAEITTTKNMKIYLSHNGSQGLFTGQGISSIGVTACDKKYMYQVLCGLNEQYNLPIYETVSSASPCKIVAEGSEAAQIAGADNQAMQKHADEQKEQQRQREKREKDRQREEREKKERQRQQQQMHKIY